MWWKVLLTILSINLLPTSGWELSLTNNTNTFGWTFPNDRPYHYFESTGYIGDSFLPVSTALLPEGSGVWVLCYEDFSSLANTYDSDKDGPSISTIGFTTQALLFYAVRIKAVVYGNVDLEFTTNVGVILDQREKISLLANQNCIQSSDSGELRWISYEVDIPSSSHVLLQKKFMLNKLL